MMILMTRTEKQESRRNLRANAGRLLCREGGTGFIRMEGLIFLLIEFIRLQETFQEPYIIHGAADHLVNYFSRNCEPPRRF